MGLDLHAYRGLEKVADIRHENGKAYNAVTGKELDDADYEQYFIPMIEPELASFAGSLTSS